MTPEEMDELRHLVNWYQMQISRAAFAERKAASCQGKDRFATNNQARQAISPRLSRFAHAYQCNICHQWHVGGLRAFRYQRIRHLMDRRQGK